MSRRTALPNAWDDDWETQADRGASLQPLADALPQVPQTRAHILAQHVESNRKLWESAETPRDTFHFVEANNNNIPLASSFKPQVKVLSRKPTGALAASSLDDAEESGSSQLSPEEIRAQQKRIREEKQRRYEEARAKIFGESGASSGASSPGTVTPPRQDAQYSARGRGARGRGASGTPRSRDAGNDFRGGNNVYQRANERNNDGRGGAAFQRGGERTSDDRSFDNRRQNPHPAPARELYDPDYSSRPDTSLYGQSRGTDGGSPMRISTPRNDLQQAIRAPKGPDGSGRGGFGFAPRSGMES